MSLSQLLFYMKYTLYKIIANEFRVWVILVKVIIAKYLFFDYYYWV
jgi:hypothetical protein